MNLIWETFNYYVSSSAASGAFRKTTHTKSTGQKRVKKSTRTKSSKKLKATGSRQEGQTTLPSEEGKFNC